MAGKTLNLKTFKIQTPPDDGDYSLSLGGTSLKTKTLRAGVIKLLNLTGGSARPIDQAEIIELIKRQPESVQKGWLLSILDNSPEPHQQAQDKQEIASSPVTEEITTPPEIVTINNPPVKPPYHRRGQSNMYDDVIKKAIAASGSSRSISHALLQQGIIISHMTISRRMNGK